MSPTAQQLIAREQEQRTGTLNLGRCGLTELPKELFSCTWLKTLVLSNRLWNYKTQKWENAPNTGLRNYIIPIRL